MTIHAAVVDDLRINRRGTAAVLREIDGVEVVGVYDFDEALARPAWDDVDWIIADVAEETNEDEQVRVVPLLQKIRSMYPDPRDPNKPWTVAVTGNPQAYDNPFLLRRLVEAEPDVGVVWRPDLDRHLEEILSGEQLHQRLRSYPAPDAPVSEFGDRPRPLAPLDIPAHGTDAGTLYNDLVEGARKIVRAAAAQKGRSAEGKLLVSRALLAAKAKVKPVTKEGLTPHNTDVPSLPLYKRVDNDNRLS